MLKGFLENVDEMLTDGEYRHLFSYKKALCAIRKKEEFYFCDINQLCSGTLAKNSFYVNAKKYSSRVGIH